MQLLKKILVPLIAVALLAGFGWLVYQQLFLTGSDEDMDVEIVYVEGAISDKPKVVAECAVVEDKQFCFKDKAWAEKENSVEFIGYAVVEFTNGGEVVMELSKNTALLSSSDDGTLILRSTEPSDIFVPIDSTQQIRYEISFDTKSDETLNKIMVEGLDIAVTFKNEIGKSATEEFTVEYKN